MRRMFQVGIVTACRLSTMLKKRKAKSGIRLMPMILEQLAVITLINKLISKKLILSVWVFWANGIIHTSQRIFTMKQTLFVHWEKSSRMVTYLRAISLFIGVLSVHQHSLKRRLSTKTKLRMRLMFLLELLKVKYSI